MTSQADVPVVPGTDAPPAAPVGPRRAGLNDARRVMVDEVPGALRQLSVCVLAGALTGLVAGGIGGRLAMMLLARLNPAATGVQSDDDFRIGQLTASGTISLLMVGLFLGLFGGVVYAVVRGLMIGPRWFQLTSISVGPAIVVGTTLVHTDGVDFTLLDPPLLAIGLFVLIPGLYALAVAVLADRWLLPNAWPSRAHPIFVAVSLLPLIVLPPLMILLTLGFLTVTGFRHTEFGQRPDVRNALAWVLRGGLTIGFVVAVIDLVNKTLVLT